MLGRERENGEGRHSVQQQRFGQDHLLRLVDGCGRVAWQELHPFVGTGLFPVYGCQFNLAA